MEHGSGSPSRPRLTPHTRRYQHNHFFSRSGSCHLCPPRPPPTFAALLFPLCSDQFRGSKYYGKQGRDHHSFGRRFPSPLSRWGGVEGHGAARVQDVSTSGEIENTCSCCHGLGLLNHLLVTPFFDLTSSDEGRYMSVSYAVHISCFSLPLYVYELVVADRDAQPQATCDDNKRGTGLSPSEYVRSSRPLQYVCACAVSGARRCRIGIPCHECES